MPRLRDLKKVFVMCTCYKIHTLLRSGIRTGYFFFIHFHFRTMCCIFWQTLSSKYRPSFCQFIHKSSTWSIIKFLSKNLYHKWGHGNLLCAGVNNFQFSLACFFALSLCKSWWYNLHKLEWEENFLNLLISTHDYDMYIRMSTMKPKLFGIQFWWYQTCLLT